MGFDPNRGGNNFSNYGNPYYNQQPQQPPKKNKGLLIGIVIVGILLAGFVVGGIVLLNSNENPADKNLNGGVGETPPEKIEVEILDKKDKESK